MSVSERANAIGAAAKRRDLKETLNATSHTLQACTSCHASYTQHVVDADTWQALTQSDHVPHH